MLITDDAPRATRSAGGARLRPGSVSPAARQWHVLVADADAELRLALRAHLEGAGFAVHTAADGLQALYALEWERPDVVVLDLLLPKVSGFRVLHLLKQRRAGTSAPLTLVLTSLSFEEARDAVRDGVDDIAIKPLEAAEVAIRVRCLLDQRDGAVPSRTGPRL